MNVIADKYNSDESSTSLMNRWIDRSNEFRLNNDINKHIYGGGNVSHILNININRSTNHDISNQIRQQVFHKINNIPIMFTIRNIQVNITWRSNSASNHYHADVMGIYGDVAVKLHSEMLLKMFDLTAYGGGSMLDFIITKPLVRTIPILPSEVKHTSDGNYITE